MKRYLIFCQTSYEVAVVNWFNDNKIQFDWQIRFKMPSGRSYIVDALIKSGTFANIYIEIKGWWRHESSREKWKWFQENYKNSELWDHDKLIQLGILT